MAQVKTIAAVDFTNGKPVKRWYVDSEPPGVPKGYPGQGIHQMSMAGADVDGDGRYDIVCGAMALNDDGTPL